MKRCPKCNRTYQDDTLRFCLEDGSLLTSATREGEAPSTAILPAPTAPTQKSAVPTIPSYPNIARASASETRQSNPLLTAGVITIALLLLLLVGIVGYFVLKHSGADQTNQTASNPRPAPTTGSNQTVKATPNDRDDAFTSTAQTGNPLKITPSSSSVRLAVQSNTYYPANAIDGKRTTCWMEGVDGPGIGEWIRFDFDREIKLHRILIQPGYFKSPAIWAQNNRIASLTAEFSDGSSRQLSFDDRMDSQKVDVGAVRTRWVRLKIASVYYGTDPDTAISEIAFEWEP
ncbi:MAG TPA: discoidin domain-containing protein [Pyrinomonadaceae bacterium]|nr:discoidin domain-containing protein [Pyrinomonadaceae bacterium]